MFSMALIKDSKADFIQDYCSKESNNDTLLYHYIIMIYYSRGNDWAQCQNSISKWVFIAKEQCTGWSVNGKLGNISDKGCSG